MITSPNIVTDHPRTETVQDDFETYKTFPGLNNSALKLFDAARGGAPAKSAWYMNNAHAEIEHDEETSEALRFGSLYHTFALERQKFDSKTALLDDEMKAILFESALAAKSKAKGFSKNLATYRAWKAEHEAAGVTVIDEGAMAKLSAMERGLQSDPDIAEAMAAPCLSEVSIYFGLPFGERFIQCKARVDSLPINGPDVLDLKTTRNANAEDFARSMPKFGYDLQAAWYLRACRAVGLAKTRFRFIAQEKDQPYLSAIYDIPDDWLRYADHEISAILSRVKLCLESGRWEGHVSGELMPPAYMDSIIEQIS